MNDIYDKLINILKDFEPIKSCTNNCTKCRLNKTVMEIYWDTDYEEFTICDLLEKIKEKL